MPKKQTRESIEAELNASRMERLLAELKETLHLVEEFEADLQKRERKAGIKNARDRPLVDRLAALGMPEEALEETAELLGAFELIMEDRPEDLSQRVRRKLAETAEAGISALDQLQDVIDARRLKWTDRLR
jgi:hypothetical protein